MKLVGAVLGIAVAVPVLVGLGFVAGYQVGSPGSRSVVEFCVVSSETASSRGCDAGDLVFADPGSGCFAGELLLCGRYSGPKQLDVVEESVESAECP